MYAQRLPTRTHIHICGCSYTPRVSHLTTDLTPIHLPYLCRACHYGQCFSAQASINAKYLEQLIKSRTSARIVQGLQFRPNSATSTGTTSSQRDRETGMLAAQIKIIDTFQKEEKEIWRTYRERWESQSPWIFHTESFLQWDNPQILPQTEPDARHSTALVEAFDAGTIGLTASPAKESPEPEWERIRKWEEGMGKIEKWDGLWEDVERDWWPLTPLS